MDNLLPKMFDYDPDTGVITRKIRTEEQLPDSRVLISFNARFAGKEAGSIKQSASGTSYRQLKIMDRMFSAHRLAWFLHYGKWPVYEVDHIDRDGLNNKISNLRDVPHMVNSQNPKQWSKKDLPTGVVWRSNVNKYHARIQLDGVMHSLGQYPDLLNAVCARKSAENRLNYGQIVNLREVQGYGA
jgi:hypothetical protein